jgi:Zn-dependent peptidase ImmA (M78 family)/DNA-binding XRE family transcriptional regulator
MEHSFNAARLSVARRRRGLSRRALAELVAIPERTVAAYEQGERVPPAEAVQSFAHALDFPAGFFSGPDLEFVPSDSVSFRKYSRTAAARRERALAGGELAMELNAWLEAHFELPQPDIPDLRPQKEPEAAAMALRGRWELADKPISNMVRLLEAKGVRVFSLAEDSRDVDAFSFWRGGQPFVFLNTLKSAERSRFDAAHELGHLVLHRHGPPNGRLAEREADQFASAFLMPRASVLALAPQFPTVERLIRAKRYWKVAVSALAVRMHDVGLISDWSYRSLMMEIQSRGYRRTEPDGVQREMSQVFEKVFAALRSDGTKRQDLARKLHWPVAELDALVFQLVIGAVPGGGADAPTPSPNRKRLSLVS